jgi:hypothetical protein
VRLIENEVGSVGSQILGSNYVTDPSVLKIRSRSVTSRAFADNADDILPRARTSAQVQFALPLARENVRSYQSFSWMFPLPTFARANDKKLQSDTVSQHPDPACSVSWGCGSTRKCPKVRRMWFVMDRIPLHDFGVACLVSANIFVGRILLRSAGITDCRRQDSLQIAESLFDPPKAAGAKCCLLRVHGNKME